MAKHRKIINTKPQIVASSNTDLGGLIFSAATADVAIRVHTLGERDSLLEAPFTLIPADTQLTYSLDPGTYLSVWSEEPFELKAQVGTPGLEFWDLQSLYADAIREHDITTLSHFIYNPVTDKLEADRAIQTTLNSLFLGEQHKMSSGAANIYFTDLSTKINWHPASAGMKDQSILANRDMTGIIPAQSRVFSALGIAPLGGLPLAGTSIPYDGDNFFSFNISGVGISLVAAEAVANNERLRYSLSVDGVDVYEQFLTPLSLQPAPANGVDNWIEADQAITWYFDHPLDIVAGSTNHASIHRIDSEGNVLGLFNVNQGNDGTGRYQTNVINRLFVDKELAFKDDVAAIVSGSTYKGTYNDLTSTPTLPTGSDVLGDFYRVSTTGLSYTAGDILVFNGTSYDHIAEASVTQSDLVTSSLRVHDVYAKAGYIGAVSDGSILYPYADIATAISAADDGDSIYLDGIFSIAEELILPADKSLFFYGSDTTTVQYATYSDGNGSIFYFDGTDSTKEFKFQNIRFKNAGGYGLYTKKTKKITIDQCTFTNNGWGGTGLHTVAPSATTGLLGYDSTASDLQAFYASPAASNGGAMRIEESTTVMVVGNTATHNLRGIRVQDCGIGGAGVISRNQSTQNIESGIYVAAGALGGSQNITVMMNVSAYNANNGMLVIGGLNNKFSQNEVSGNWNAGFCAWGAGNTTLRDCGLYDNNRSEFNGIGNVGDAKASIQINEAYNLLGTTISLNPAFRFIAEVLDTQVHYTGLGSTTSRIGFLITPGVGLLPANDKNIIKVDDVGFIGQDYAIDFSEVDLTNLKVALGDNSFMSIGEKAVRQPSSGAYFELPFSNHTTNINYADFSVDVTGNVIVHEGVGGSRLNPYKVNELVAQAFGTKIRVMLKGSNKVQFEVPVSGCSIDGAFVNSVLNQAIIQLNNVFTNTVGFASGGGNDVTNFVLSGDDLTITLADATSFTVDVTSLGVDENKFVASGAISGSDLELTMDDASVITIDMSNMINGSSLTAANDKWFISYGTNANQEVGVSVNDPSVNQQLPFYFGQALEQGSEFKWNFQSNGGANLILGIWDGAEVATAYNGGSITASNWGTMFIYAGGFTDGTNSTLLTTNSGAKYAVPTGDAMGIRFDNAGYLTLIHYTGGTEVAVAKTDLALAVTSFNMQMHTWQNGTLPNGIINNVDYIWDIVHDFANTEAGIINGILDHTVLKSAISIGIGEKIMFMLDEVGQGDFFGTGYTAASSGVTTAETQLDNTFVYQTNEAIVFDTAAGVSDWNANTNAPHYFNSASLNQYREGGAGTIQGMFSLRFNDDGKLTIYDEDAGVKIATAKMDPPVDGSVHLYFGVKGNRAYYSIPVISKQTLNSGSQPDVNFVPAVADQTVGVVEGEVLNYQVVSSTNIVNQFVEVNAPSWMLMNQATGVLSGTAPAFAGTAADTIVVSCKAGNAIGGTVNFTVTVTVSEAAASYANTKSLSFNDPFAFLQGNPTTMNALERATNGDGNAWTISMWVKPNAASGVQTLMVYGAGDDYNGGAITLKQSGTTLLLNYGTVYAYVIVGASNALPANTWTHVLVAFDGGTTGSDSNSLSDYYSRFTLAINGAIPTPFGYSTAGYAGAISGANVSDNIYRIGRASNVHNNYYGGIINQVAIWDTDQSANIATIYNSGATQDLSLLAAAPAHYYEIENSITTISDKSGNADLTGYNFAAGDLVTDAPS